MNDEAYRTAPLFLHGKKPVVDNHPEMEKQQEEKILQPTRQELELDMALFFSDICPRPNHHLL